MPEYKYLWQFCPQSCHHCPPPGPPPGPPKTIYVASTGGTNNASCGTNATAPCATLNYAVSSRASYGDTVVAMPGVHAGAGGDGIQLPDGITVTGGFSGTTATVLDCQGSGRGFDISSGHGKIYNMTVRNCTLAGPVVLTASRMEPSS